MPKKMGKVKKLVSCKICGEADKLIHTSLIIKQSRGNPEGAKEVDYLICPVCHPEEAAEYDVSELVTDNGSKFVGKKKKKK